MIKLAWGSHTPLDFCQGVVGMCFRLGIAEPSWLMACMAFETGESFSPSVRNAAGSGAVGLIQFMPTTAALLGTTVEQLAELTATAQLLYVEKYFSNRKGQLRSLGDVYGAILWPSMIGKPDDAVIFRQEDPNHPKLYLQNRGLDFNHDGHITKGEVVARVQRELDTGLLPENARIL